MIPEEELKRLFRVHQGNIAFLLGAASGCVNALDFDERGGYQEAKAYFEARYGKTRTVKSYRGGHIYFRTDQPIKSGKLTWGLGELRAQSSYVMAPPSLHPMGIKYEYETWVDTIPTVEDLPYCELKIIAPGERETKSIHRITDSPLGVTECLAIMDVFDKKTYSSRSERDMAIILSLVNRRVPLGRIREAFKQTHLETHYRRLQLEQGQEIADRNLETSHAKALTLPHDPKYLARRDEVIQQAESLRAAIYNSPQLFRGRCRSIDIDVLLAHVATYEKCMKPSWNLSQREGAEVAQCNKATFGQSTKRLIESGLIIPTKSSDRYNEISHEYGFGPHLKIFLTEPNTHPLTKCECLANEENFETETYGVFERKVLKKAAKHVYFALLRHGDLSQKELEEKTGLTRSTISKSLQTLLKYEIAIKDGRKYRAVSGFDFKQLNEELGAYELEQKRKSSHQADRARYHAGKEHYALKAK